MRIGISGELIDVFIGKRQTLFNETYVRKIFGPESDEQTGEWEKLHNMEFHNLYGNADIIRTLN